MAQIIDFSMIDRISAKDTAVAEEQERMSPEQAEEQASFLQAGSLALVPPLPSPPEIEEKTPQPEGASQEKRGAFTDHTGSRDYNRMYRIAHEYHRKHSPPVVDKEYWRTHTPGMDDTPAAEAQYWIRAAEDIGAASESGLNDALLMALLTAAYDELEREYKAIREEACRNI